jgi:hypothetical protein
MKLPKLSLRDLFWLVLAAACLCAWCSETWQMRMQLLRQMQEIEHFRALHEPDDMAAQRAYQQAQQSINRGPPSLPIVAPGE